MSSFSSSTSYSWLIYFYRAAQLVYEEDVLKYGPLDPEFPTISPERLDDWIKVTHRYAAASANTV